MQSRVRPATVNEDNHGNRDTERPAQAWVGRNVKVRVLKGNTSLKILTIVNCSDADSEKFE